MQNYCTMNHLSSCAPTVQGRAFPAENHIIIPYCLIKCLWFAEFLRICLTETLLFHNLASTQRVQHFSCPMHTLFLDSLVTLFQPHPRETFPLFFIHLRPTMPSCHRLVWPSPLGLLPLLPHPDCWDLLRCRTCSLTTGSQWCPNLTGHQNHSRCLSTVQMPSPYLQTLGLPRLEVMSLHI